ncbi:MAG TPA: L-threonylcarbamoyladenylate synthase [Lacunisphaera sp.]|nr:L-threonylcarbamoyladenylate synthase [Lacunisphaera sp.]
MPAKIHAPTPANLRRLAGVLRAGGLVAIPTETVYGLAAHALDARACRAIFRAKGRPANDPLIVHVPDLAHAEELAEFNTAARRVARRFWPGPLTIVLPKKACVPGIVTSGGPTVALRSPAHPLARQLLKLAGVPLAAPSANPFSYISPTTATHVQQGLGKRIAHILDGGPCPVGVESTVLDLTHPTKPRILRPGAITAAQLEKVLKRKVATTKRSATSKARLAAPGLLARHYSPRTPLRLVARPASKDPRTALIFLRKCTEGGTTCSPGRFSKASALGSNALHRGPVYWLSERGALDEIARNLYRVLREADAGGYREIRLEKLPPATGGLAAAVHDRMKRAAAK